MATISYDECKVEHETHDGLLVHIPEVSDDAQWLPKSSIDKEESEVQKNGDEGTLVVHEWIAIKKEWV